MMQAAKQESSETPSIEKILAEFKWLRSRYEEFHDFVKHHHPELIELWKVHQALELYRR